MIDWKTCQQDFEPDGALRDIYVLGTTVDDWNTLFDMLRAKFQLEYWVDHVARPLPALAGEALAIQGTYCPSLNFKVGDIVFACYFFDFSEIEFDFWPAKVTSQATLDELLGFIRLLGDTIGKQVILCYESMREHPFISYDSSRQEFKYHEYPALPDDVA